MRRGLIVSILVLAIAGIYATWTLTRNRAEAPPRATGASENGDDAGRIANFAPSDPPAAVPDFSFVDAAGATHHLKDFAGKLILVNFWATWCAPCRQEMPSLDRLQARLGGPDFQVVPVSLDHGGAARVRDFLRDNAIHHLPVYLDSGSKSLALFGFPGLPTSIMIDADGRERGRLIGPAQWDSPEAIALIDKLRHGAAEIR